MSEPAAEYSAEEKPLGSYATIAAIFNVGLAGFLLAASRAGRLPERTSLSDVVLVGVATQKLSRLVAKDKVTSFLRAPFTRFEEASGHGEVEEEPRGEGLQRAVGELAVCPYCLALWTSAAFMAGLVVAPRPTRVVAGVFASLSLADFLQLAYKAAEQKQ